MPAQSPTPFWQPAIPSYTSTYNWQSPIPSHMGNSNLQPPIGRHHDAVGLFNQNILNRGKREQRTSFYKWTPYTEQPPTTVLPKQRGNKNKNNVKKANLSPLNLGNAFDDENEGGDDVKRENYVNYTDFLNDHDQIYLDFYMKGYSVPVTFWQQLVPHLCMTDIDSRTPIGLVPLANAIQERDMILMYTHHNRLHVYVSRAELSPLVVAEQHKDEKNKTENQEKPSCSKKLFD
ncbi:hypothetical protein Tco_0876322 [Tanacetum coccineum]|uniref:Uncharacterized protein n=1 Tax=Tanacetum coccineum TaxID=301880 RepID=A0ABQ5BRY5_9ASTR